MGLMRPDQLGPSPAGDSDPLPGILLRPTRHHRTSCLPPEERVERLGRVGSWEIDQQGRVAAWSAGARRLFQVPADVPPSFEAMVDALVPEDGLALRRMVAGSLRSHVGFDLILRLRTGSAPYPGRLRLIAELALDADRGRRLCGIVRDVTEECALAGRLRHLAEHDPLTGLGNRRALLAALGAWPAQDGPARMLLVRLELDRFEAINEHHGRTAGDAILVEIADRLRRSAPDARSVVRLDGGEFALLLPENGDLGRRLRRIRAGCAAPVHLGAARLWPGVSLGAVVQGPAAPGRERSDPETLLHDAAIALRQAKARGRRRTRVFRPCMRAALDTERLLLDQADAALARDEFELHYQPIIDLRTRALRGVEALLRWRHPTRGLLAPGAFAAVLRDPDLSARIGEAVLDRGLAQLRAWEDAGTRVPCVSVNVAQSQLECGPELFAQIELALRRRHLAPDRLRIEIVEDAFLGHRSDTIARTIERLRNLGVVTALDDFGTGHASLTHLKTFAVGHIKIDRSFVSDLEQPDSRAITRAIIDLGANLGIRVVAEGVETPEQLAILLAAGCDCGQGYLFSRPLPAPRIPDFLDDWEAEGARLFAGALIPPPR